MTMTTWRKLLTEKLGEDVLIANTMSSSAMDDAFDDGFGGAEGQHFTAWSKTRVYFPVVYDGAEWVESVPRNPCTEACEHIGGG